jgi:hypothetical protein
VGFWRLSRGRTAGFSGPNPIAMSERLSYCQAMAMDDPAAIDEFIEVTGQMDQAFMTWVRAQKS